MDALRRAARANPSDPKATLTLAENLARQFRTEEAIELFWRAFARTPKVEERLSIVSRMADQYLQRNQLDRLLSRLERELREPNQQRELSLCLAQAHASAGDLGSARVELERLIATNPRDTQLLSQLSEPGGAGGGLRGGGEVSEARRRDRPEPRGDEPAGPALPPGGRTTRGRGDLGEGGRGGPGRRPGPLGGRQPAGGRQAGRGPGDHRVGLLRSRRTTGSCSIARGSPSPPSTGRPRPPRPGSGRSSALKIDDDKGILARSRGNASGPNADANAPDAGRAEPADPGPIGGGRPRPEPGDEPDRTTAVWRLSSPLDLGQARVAALAWRSWLAQRDGQGQTSFNRDREAARDGRPATRGRLGLVLSPGSSARITPRPTRPRGTRPAPARRLSAQWAYLSSLGNRAVRTSRTGRRCLPARRASAAPDPNARRCRPRTSTWSWPAIEASRSDGPTSPRVPRRTSSPS